MSISNLFFVKWLRVRLERDINIDEMVNYFEENMYLFFVSDIVEIYRREWRIVVEIDGDRDGSY